MRHLTLALVALLAACDGPVEVERPLLLGNINGQPLPWAVPGDTMVRPLKITEGWILIHDGGMAERHERYERWFLTTPTDSQIIGGDWTHAGTYQWMPGRIVITYLSWSPGPLAPSQAVETLYVTDRGLTLRETGFVPPLDSMIRAFCAQPPC